MQLLAAERTHLSCTVYLHTKITAIKQLKQQLLFDETYLFSDYFPLLSFSPLPLTIASRQIVIPLSTLSKNPNKMRINYESMER